MRSVGSHYTHTHTLYRRTQGEPCIQHHAALHGPQRASLRRLLTRAARAPTLRCSSTSHELSEAVRLWAVRACAAARRAMKPRLPMKLEGGGLTSPRSTTAPDEQEDAGRQHPTCMIHCGPGHCPLNHAYLNADEGAEGLRSVGVNSWSQSGAIDTVEVVPRLCRMSVDVVSKPCRISFELMSN